MKRSNLLIFMLLIVAALQLSACAPKATTIEKISPSVVETIEGSDLKRVILTQKATERLNIQMGSIHDEQVNGVNRSVVPYAAIIYDLEGKTWLYTSPAPLTFVREPITIEFIEGDTAVLTNGPSSGTEVVIVGVPELYGTETGVSE